MKTESNEILGHREGEDIQLQSIPSHHLAPWGFRPQIAEAASCMDLPTILIPKENPSSEMPTSHIRPGRRYESRSRLDCSVVNLPQQQAQTRTHTDGESRWRCQFWHRWHIIQQHHRIKRKQQGPLPTNPTSELKEIQQTIWQFPQVPPNIVLQKNDSPRTPTEDSTAK